MGFEPTVSSATNWRFNQLSYIHHMARQKGLEPLTYCLEGSCSIQLSYRHMYVLRTCMFLRPLDFSIRNNYSGAPLNEKFVFTAEP